MQIAVKKIKAGSMKRLSLAFLLVALLAAALSSGAAAMPGGPIGNSGGSPQRVVSSTHRDRPDDTTPISHTPIASEVAYNTPEAIGPQDYNDTQLQLLLATNQARRTNGRGPLRLNANLMNAAQWLANDMGVHHYFDHTDSQQRSFDQRLSSFGYTPYNAIAENIAAGYATVPDAINAWLGSPGHRTNMLNATYREIGVGFANVAASGYARYWVQDFGLRSNVYPVVINNEAPTTDSPNVSLYIYGTGYASQMMVSNRADFSGAAWQSYQTEISWQLVGGNGLQSVYVKLRTSGGSEQTNSDEITLTNQPTAIPVLTATPMPTATTCPGQHFSDVDCTYWAYSYIQSLATSGVIGGYADGSFRPHSNVSRAELAKMIVIAGGWATVTPTTPHFNDVPANHWAYRFVETAYALNVIGGYSDGSYKPTNLVTRDQLAKIVVKARGYDRSTPSNPTFSDVPASYWAYGYIEQAAALNILGGYSNGTFGPGIQTQRDQLSKTLYNALAVPTATPTTPLNSSPATSIPAPTGTPTVLAATPLGEQEAQSARREWASCLLPPVLAAYSTPIFVAD